MAEIIPLRTSESAPAPKPEMPALDPLWREAVGDVFRDVRHSRGERLADVARRSGVSVQYLSEVERGRKEPSSEMIAAIAGSYDLSLLDLTLAVAERLAPAATGAVLRVA